MSKKKSKAGRKPIDPSEKAILVGFYVKQRIIDLAGGLQSARDWSKKKFEECFR